MKAKKSLGQNFLTDKNKINTIIEKLPTLENFSVVEVGPGMGALTKELISSNVNEVIAIEIDKDMVEILGEIKNPKFTLIHKDILDIEWDSILPKDTRLQFISNLPYYISTKIIFKVAKEKRFEYMSVMLQKELIDRIVAKSSTKEFGRLTVSVNALFEVIEKIKVPRGSFTPSPNVDSGFIILKRKNTDFNEENFLAFVKAAFGLKRKTLVNSLKQYMPNVVKMVLKELDRLEIKKNIRAEQLNVETYILIFKSFNI